MILKDIDDPDEERRAPWTDIDWALAIYAECCAEAEHWHTTCVNHERICGPGIWRERHPMDREKLYKRRIWRVRRRTAGRWIDSALDAWRPTAEQAQ